MTALVHVDLAPVAGEPIAAKILRAGQARALEDFAKEVKAHTYADLQDAALEDVESAGGGGFSRTVDGVRATVSDPQPKPSVTNQEAFAEWWVAKGLDHDVKGKVTVINQDELFGLLAIFEDGVCDYELETLNQMLQEIAATVRLSVEYVLPANALDNLIATGAFTSEDVGLIDTTTGELVPGVTCSRARQTLSVTPDKSAKARNRHAILTALGLEQDLAIGTVAK